MKKFKFDQEGDTMSDWNPEKYLLFKDQRTQPALDLANRVRSCQAKTVVDIGCGPGNSTAVLKDVFPHAKILGIDNSANMISKAKAQHSGLDFQVCSAEDLTGSYDLLFSNACLQWIPNHETLIPQLMGKLTEHGVLTVQMPMNWNEPLFRIIKAVAAKPKWDFKNVCFERNDTLSPEAYFDILSACSGSFEIWETVYYHAMPSHEHLIEWVRGTRLRPYLDVLNEEQKVEFEQEILSMVRDAYPFTASGEGVLKFRRFFFFGIFNIFLSPLLQCLDDRPELFSDWG